MACILKTLEWFGTVLDEALGGEFGSSSEDEAIDKLGPGTAVGYTSEDEAIDKLGPGTAVGYTSKDVVVDELGSGAVDSSLVKRQGEALKGHYCPRCHHCNPRGAQKIAETDRKITSSSREIEALNNKVLQSDSRALRRRTVRSSREGGSTASVTVQEEATMVEIHFCPRCNHCSVSLQIHQLQQMLAETRLRLAINATEKAEAERRQTELVARVKVLEAEAYAALALKRRQRQR